MLPKFQGLLGGGVRGGGGGGEGVGRQEERRGNYIYFNYIVLLMSG